MLGDSWSADIWQEPYRYPGYNPEHCLRRQIECESGEFVINFSRAAAGHVSQLEKIKTQIHPDTSARVLMAATDWYRDFIKDPLKFTGTYNQDLLKANAYLKEILHNLETTHPNLKWYHWGGQNCVWYKSILPQSHSVLYEDYAHEQYATLKTETGLTTWWDSLDRFFNSHIPNTDKKQRKQLIKETVNCMKYRAVNTILFPDGGHLDWRLYKPLVTRFLETE